MDNKKYLQQLYRKIKEITSTAGAELSFMDTMIDMYDKVYKGTFHGGNLTTALKNKNLHINCVFVM